MTIAKHNLKKFSAPKKSNIKKLTVEFNTIIKSIELHRMY